MVFYMRFKCPYEVVGCPMTVLLGLPRVDANSDSGGLVAYFYGGMCLHPYKAPAIGQLRGVNRTKAVAAAEGKGTKMSHQEMLVSRPGDQQMTANVSACGVNANVLAQARREANSKKWRYDLPPLEALRQLAMREKQQDAVTLGELGVAKGRVLGVVDSITHMTDGAVVVVIADEAVWMYSQLRNQGLANKVLVDFCDSKVQDTDGRKFMTFVAMIDNPAAETLSAHRPRPIELFRVVTQDR
ncbi:hypothetical protein MNEG_14718 [Monoraphidium neglectum]|uniref:Uncharacterized protein n=1 Tax=Monoraphidium neglectum TaxID=145388 RepID=A0A0D2MDF3_9CHLO|nr:hypothetical protein MNEG_14718 [Monoraphidium neglectum]KIY93245.1 hypothetical protein MNEG_14718 [Monoraphidium neglectum]|eukprot:XP_013892265.1 hypothetical protein MNEG_14718 [Monoraphidium neglectum]